MSIALSRRAAVLSLVAFAAVSLGGCTRKNENAPGAGGGVASGSAPGSTQGGGGKTGITVKGSDTMVQLSQRWAEEFMKANAGKSIQVTGGGSGTGIAALINGGTDVCNASRPMKDAEKNDVKAKRGADAVETKVALDALAIYVNEKSKLTEIDLETLAKIYKGEVTNWKDAGGPDHAITLYGRENNSGTYGYFKEHVLANKDFAASVQTLAGTSAVANAVKGDEFGVGYGGIAYASGIRLLKVKKTKDAPAIEPKESTAIDGTYPISRYLYVYTAGQPAGLVKDFITFMTSDAGQKVVNDVGYFKLPK
jgi:phosphate transport system substrate-binding protein